MEKRQNLRALHTFEVVSRHLSVAAAARELGVTQSAVSHQIRLLSETVGERLTLKRGRGIILTEAGQNLARKLQPAFAEIDRSMSDAIGGRRDRVRLAICSSFAQAWLIPRLESFYQTCADIDLQIMMYARDPELTDAVGDAFVTTLPKEKGYHALFLWAEHLVPVVCAKTLNNVGREAIDFITTDLADGSIGQDWFAHARRNDLSESYLKDRRFRFASHYVLALQMVRQGLGAALVPDFLARDGLRSGDIVLLDDTVLATNEDYHLCIKESRRGEPALDALTRWLKQELLKDGP